MMDYDYIEGKSFLSSFPFKVKQEGPMVERMEFVEDIIRDQKVLHIGCASHLPNIEGEISQDNWFHNRLTKAASECLGIDINREAIELLVSQYNVNNICYGNIESEEEISSIMSSYWDYAIFAEVLEHVDNPVSFLQKFVDKYGEHIGKIIITVPNCYQLRNIKALFSNLELINSDHRYWFSPYTIWKVIHQAGLKLDKLQMCKNYSTTKIFGGKIKDIFLEKYPIMAQNIVLIASKP